MAGQPHIWKEADTKKVILYRSRSIELHLKRIHLHFTTTLNIYKRIDIIRGGEQANGEKNRQNGHDIDRLI